MFRALLKRQLAELLAPFYRSRLNGKARSKAGRAAFALLILVLLAVLLACFGSLAVPLAMVLAPRGLGWLYFAVMELAALALGTAAGAFVSYSVLFNARDNELLLSLPVPPRAFLAARALRVYGSCLCYLLLALVPAEAVWVYYTGSFAAALLSFVPLALALGCVCTAFACAVGGAAAALSAHVRRKSLTAAAITVMLLALYAAGIRRAEKLLGALLARAVYEPGSLRPALGAAYLLGGAACGNALALVVLVLLSAGLLALAGAVLSRRYFALIATANAAPAEETRQVLPRVHGLRAALLLRELRRFASSAPYLINGAAGWLFVSLMAAAALLEPDAMRSLLAQLPLPAVCGALCAMAGIAPVAAPSVSLEGKALWIIQSLPVEPRFILCAKLELQLAVSAPPAFFCAACMLALGGYTAPEAAACLLVLALYALFAAQLGLCFGLFMPNLGWTSEAAMIKQSGASVLAALSNMAAALALAALAAALAEPFGTAALLVCAAVLALACMLLARWLRSGGAKRFARL